jgi:hypothetical protein
MSGLLDIVMARLGAFLPAISSSSESLFQPIYMVHCSKKATSA